MIDRSTSRYAIYFTPHPARALWRFGCEVIGYDAAGGCDVPQFDHPVLRAELTPSRLQEPARYGFHATLKAPFELAAGATCAEILAAAHRFAARQRPIALSRLAVTRMTSFLALTPVESPTELRELADSCVCEFDQFRAPLSPADRARRMTGALSLRQVGHLDRWGYPYVFDDFRFHMTLTGPLPEAAQDVVARALRELYEPITGPVAIDAISVLEQASRFSRFRVLKRFDFPEP